MSQINRHNYEAFYLDYLEGNLDASVQAQLLLFLEQHPELKAQVEDVDLVELPDEAVHFDRALLKQEITPANAEQFIIADLEGQLDAADQSELQTLVQQDTELQKLTQRYTRTKLIPEVTAFPNKHKLKKKGAVIYWLGPAMGAAAAGLVLLTLNLGTEGPTGLAEGVKPVVDSLVEPVVEVVEQHPDAEQVDATEPELEMEVEREEPQMAIKPIKATTDQPVEPEGTHGPLVAAVAPVDTIVEQLGNPELSVLADLDSAIHVDDPIEPATQSVAVVADVTPSTKTNTAIGVGQWVNKQVRKRILKEENPQVERVNGDEILAALASTIDENVNTNVSYNYTRNTARRTYSFSVGGVGFSRTKSR